MKQKKISETLFRFFPVESVEKISELITTHGFHLTFRKGRSTKLGDFRPGRGNIPSVITLNSDLNPYSGLLVFLHELAHLQVYENKGRSEQPHGKSWKLTFGRLIRAFVELGYFHPQLSDSLMAYSHQVKAGGLASDQLTKDLRMFDQDDGLKLLDELPLKSYFISRSGRLFRKQEQVRKRFKCYCLDNQKIYLFHPLSKVQTTNVQE